MTYQEIYDSVIRYDNKCGTVDPYGSRFSNMAQVVLQDGSTHIYHEVYAFNVANWLCIVPEHDTPQIFDDGDVFFYSLYKFINTPDLTKDF